MFNMPDINKLAQAAKEVQDKQSRADEQKLAVLQRIEQKLDKILEELKKR